MSQVASCKVDVFFHAAVRLTNGHVLRMGGYPETVDGRALNAVNYVEEYDPVGDRWHGRPEMALGRALFTATVLKSGPHRGSVLVAGGAREAYPLFYATNSAELYTPGPHGGRGTWTPVGNMRFPRAQHTATVLPGGEVLVVGGVTTNIGAPEPPPPLTSAEIFMPDTLDWREIPYSMHEPRYDHTATLLPDSTVLVAGGSNGWTAVNTAEIYRPDLGTFEYTATPMITPRLGASAELLGDNVLVAGGLVDDVATPTNTTELYDSASRKWMPWHPLELPDTHFSSYGCDAHSPLVRMPDGRLFYFHQGGLGEIERFQDRAWRVVANLLVPREGFTATLLSGRVLIVGGAPGYFEDITSRTTEVYP